MADHALWPAEDSVHNGTGLSLIHIFGSITTGAANDIEQATRIARAMVTRYGMSDQFGMVALETVNNPYLSSDTSMTLSLIHIY